MENTTPAAPRIRQYDQVQILTRIHAMRAGLATATRSLAANHRFKVLAAQLAGMVRELGADDWLGEHVAAIVSAIEARSYSVAYEACDALSLVVEGKSAPIPAVPAPAPAVIETPANDNQKPAPVDVDPVRAHSVPEQAHDVPEPTQAPDTTCSRNQEQQAERSPSTDEQLPPLPFKLPPRDQAPAWYGPMLTPEALGEALRGARATKGMSQQDVATAAGVGRRFVGEVEGGKATSEIGRVLAMCAAVGLAIVAVPLATAS